MIVTLLEVDKELTWEVCEKYVELLSEDRKNKCLRYVMDNKKIVSLLSSLLIQQKVGNGAKLDFVYNKYGKPYIKNNEKNYFSVSHSGKYIAYVEDVEEIGIDIEEIKNFNIRVAQKIFTEEENNFLTQKDNINIEGYKLWTQKEAYLKKLGTGFADGGYKINTLDQKIQQHLKTTQVENYMLTIATEDINQEIQLESISSKEFLHTLNLNNN